MTETFSLVVVAAGQGSRMGGATAKQFLPLAGRPIWEWSALSGGRLFSDNRIGECVFVVPAGTEDMVRESLRPFSFPNGGRGGKSAPIRVQRSGVRQGGILS